MEAAVLTTSAPASPTHVAIIMDGNGRWARARGLPRTAGHRRGAQAVKTAIESAIRSGVPYLTLFGFSSENWRRPAEEIGDLMGLLKHYLKTETDALNRQGVRLRVIGDRRRFGPDIVAMIERAERLTESNCRLNLTIALSYGGRAEIVEATRQIAREVTLGLLDPAAIEEGVFARHLFTADIPDPDLLIRTSGEKRISNFLLWQLAYAELVFLDTLWPDFSSDDFAAALGEFHRRERRYGTAGV
ncbi:MAG: isoprenyl transferase [Rhodospirillales bacterium]|nr:MAG: isoprenyl transferase [Rhodospirillales bacterium]